MYVLFSWNRPDIFTSLSSEINRDSKIQNMVIVLIIFIVASAS